MNLNRLAAAATIVLLCSSNAPAGVINFDDVDARGSTTGFADAGRYRGQGIQFGQNIPFLAVAAAWPGFFPTFVAQGGTTPNTTLLTLGESVGMLALDAFFVTPGTSTPSRTDFVSIRAFDTEVGSTLGTLTAFDADNAVVDTASLVTPISQSGVLTVQGSGIVRVHLSADSDGAGFDNLVFNTPNTSNTPTPHTPTPHTPTPRALPEPATWALFALGVFGVSLRKRWRPGAPSLAAFPY
jgi:PEP-CTERM motif